jgi:Ca-activated chloride channel family protein
VVILALGACQSGQTASPTPANARPIRVAYASSLDEWFVPMVGQFNAQNISDGQGKVWQISAWPLASGAIVEAMAAADQAPYDVIIPANKIWADLLAARRQERGFAPLPGLTAAECTPVAQTPVVLATWQPMAEVLGWPSRQFAWNDITDLALSPSAWAGYDFPEWGALTYGHAHPVLSDAGLMALLGQAYAASGRGADSVLTAGDIASETVQSYVRVVERSVARYAGDSTGLIAQMRARGMGYLHLAIGYESDVIRAEKISGANSPGLVAIFPAETPLAEFNVCGESAAAGAIAGFLLAEGQQRAAVAAGFRPVAAGVAPVAPLNANAVYKPLPAPPLDVVRSLQAQWETLKRPLNVVMVFDVSGSMGQSAKITFAQQGAEAFVNRLGDQDIFTLVAFSNGVTTLISEANVGQQRAQIIDQIRALLPQQGTALYAAVSQTRSQMKVNAARINAMVVMTDGRDTNSGITQPQMLQDLATARGNVTIYAIGYGADADTNVMDAIARAGNGLYFKGDPATINQVYLEIATQVGGSRGLGR